MCILPLCVFLAEIVDGELEVITGKEIIGSIDAEKWLVMVVLTLMVRLLASGPLVEK